MYSLFEKVFYFVPGGSGEPVGVGRVGDAVDTVVVTVHNIIFVYFKECMDTRCFEFIVSKLIIESTKYLLL